MRLAVVLAAALAIVPLAADLAAAKERRPLRVTVYPRSYLHPGTTPIPEKGGQYATSPMYTMNAPGRYYDGLTTQPLPGPFDLPGWSNY